MRQALGRNFEADSGHASLLPGLRLRDLAWSGAKRNRTPRQKEIASKAHAIETGPVGGARGRWRVRSGASTSDSKSQS